MIKRTAIGALLTIGLVAGAAATAAEENSVSAAATYLYLATLCEESAPPEHAANARELGDILRRLDGDGKATMKAEMQVLHEIAEIEDRDGAVDPARKAAFCAENKEVLMALGPEVQMWIHDFSPEDAPLR